MSRIFCSALGFDGGKSGISVYMQSVLTQLCKHHTLTVLCLKSDLPLLPQSDNIHYIFAPNYLRKALFCMLWHLFILPFRINKERYDFIFLPAANRRALFFYPLPTVATVHDLSQYHVPAKYDGFRMFYIKHLLPYCVRKAHRIIALSESTKRDVLQYWHIPESKVELVYNGYDPARFSVPIPEHSIDQVRQKYGLKKPFILYISRLEHPGKNHLRLMQAYEALPKELTDRYDLVMPGKDWNGAEVLHKAQEKSPLHENIRFIGFIENYELAPLYHAASLYCFPSLFEGFGLPILETMACGTALCCSSTSSIGEVAGEASLQFDPEKVDEITQALQTLLTDEKKRNALIKKGYERIKFFSWEKHAAALFPGGHHA